MFWVRVNACPSHVPLERRLFMPSSACGQKRFRRASCFHLHACLSVGRDECRRRKIFVVDSVSAYVRYVTLSVCPMAVLVTQQNSCDEIMPSGPGQSPL